MMIGRHQQNHGLITMAFSHGLSGYGCNRCGIASARLDKPADPLAPQILDLGLGRSELGFVENDHRLGKNEFAAIGIDAGDRMLDQRQIRGQGVQLLGAGLAR